MTHFLIPICFVCAWAFVLLLFSRLFALLQDTTRHATLLHQIPCSRCRFFSDTHPLKCTVHPTIAMTEAAIGCPDYQVDRSPTEEYLQSLH